MDETSTHLTMTRRYARMPRPNGYMGTSPQPRLQPLDDWNPKAAWYGRRDEYRGAVDIDIFKAFVSQVLVPVLQPGDVVRLDNLTVHHASDIEQGVREAACAVHAVGLRIPKG